VSSGAQFVVAAYAVILFVLVMYMVVVGMKSARLAREAELLARLVSARADEAGIAPDAQAAAEAAELNVRSE